MKNKRKNPNEPILDKLRLSAKPIKMQEKHNVATILHKTNPLIKWLKHDR